MNQSSFFWGASFEEITEIDLPISASKRDFLYLEYSLPLFCIPEIISVINQGFELAFTLTFVIGATESIALMILFIKSEYEAFIQAYFK